MMPTYSMLFHIGKKQRTERIGLMSSHQKGVLFCSVFFTTHIHAEEQTDMKKLKMAASWLCAMLYTTSKLTNPERHSEKCQKHPKLEGPSSPPSWEGGGWEEAAIACPPLPESNNYDLSMCKNINFRETDSNSTRRSLLTFPHKGDFLLCSSVCHLEGKSKMNEHRL